MSKIRLTKSELTKDIKERGLTRPQIAEKYAISVGQVKKALQMAGLDKERAAYVKFELVDDTPEPATATSDMTGMASDEGMAHSSN